MIVSSEAFASLFQRCEAPFLDALDDLASRHDVTVAHYVRPQDSALEGALAPVGIQRRGSTVGVGRLRVRGPQVRRGVRRGHGARARLPIRRPAVPERPAQGRQHRRRLRVALPGHRRPATGGPDEPRAHPRSREPAPRRAAAAPRTPRQSRRLGLATGRVAGISAAWDVAESDAVVEARTVLRQYARNEFEASNRTLAATLGWPIDDFVVPPADGRWAGVDDRGAARRARPAVDAAGRPRGARVRVRRVGRALESSPRRLTRGRVSPVRAP